MKSLIKVGVFATVCLIILAVLIWKIEDLNPFSVEGQRLDAVFPSVAGLDDKASVRVAGVRVGRVDGVGLDGTRARITLALDKPLSLTQGTTARIANLGLLGEKYVELVPGPPGFTAAGERRAHRHDAPGLRRGDAEDQQYRRFDPGAAPAPLPVATWAGTSTTSSATCSSPRPSCGL